LPRERNCRQTADPRRLLGHDRKRIAAGLCAQSLQIAAKNRAQHDVERQCAHVIGDIDALAALGLRFPACDEAIIRIVNDTRELRDDATVEHRLHHVALAAPEIALARHDAVAKQDLDPIEPTPLV